MSRKFMFRLYWFNTRTGYGHPALEYPDAMSYDEAFDAIRDRRGNRKRHPRQFNCELHYEPESLFEKHTCKNEAV